MSSELTNEDEASAIIGEVTELENIATALFSKLKPFDVKKINIRDIENVRYNTFSSLQFARPVESTMIIDMTMSNDTTFHFGYGNTCGDKQGAMGVTLPGSPMAFLCKHRIDTLAATYEMCPYAAERNRELWVKVAEIFEMNLEDFESFIQRTARVLGEATGIMSPGCERAGMDSWWIDHAEWIAQFKAPVKTKVITYTWD